MIPAIRIITSERVWTMFLNVFMALFFLSLPVLGFLALWNQKEKSTFSQWLVFIFILLCVIPLAKQSFLSLPPKDKGN